MAQETGIILLTCVSKDSMPKPGSQGDELYLNSMFVEVVQILELLTARGGNMRQWLAPLLPMVIFDVSNGVTLEYRPYVNDVPEPLRAVPSRLDMGCFRSHQSLLQNRVWFQLS